MSIATPPPRLMTNEEFLALPDDGTERTLIRGILWEKRMTRRNRFHSKTEAAIACFLKSWSMALSEPHGDVLSGEAGFFLTRNPDTTVGIDVAYSSAETAARQSDATAMIDGVPILAVEILSPNDTIEEINNKIDVYIGAGVKQVWIVDPHFRTVNVHRPDSKPEFYTDDDQLAGGSDLPGFQVRVAQLFD